MHSLSADEICDIALRIGSDFIPYGMLIASNNLTSSEILKFGTKDRTMEYLKAIGILNDFHLKILVDVIWSSVFGDLNISHISSANIGSTIPFPKDGITLRGIREFIVDCGGVDELQSLSTTDVCNRFLKPVTYLRKESYCDLLRAKGSTHVGVASVFISHAWKYHFLDVIDAMEYHFCNSPDIVVWFDLFSNNQHAAADLDFHWWSTTFKSAIEQFGRTVLILHPWSDPIPLTRAWCLFEIYCTATTNSIFEVAMSRTDRTAFVKSIVSDCQQQVNRMLSVVNVERSEAFNDADRRRIFEVVAASIGFDGINALVFGRMRTWVVDTAVAALSDIGVSPGDLESVRKDDLECAIGILYMDQGLYVKAEGYFRQCLERRLDLLGDIELRTAQARNNLAVVLDLQGRGNEAEELWEICAEHYLNLLGPEHLDTVQVKLNLVLLQSRQGKLASAEELCVECVDVLTRLLSATPQSITLQTQLLYAKRSLASVFSGQGRRQESVSLCVECLEGFTSLVGSSHPDTMRAQQSLGAELFNSKNYEAAANIFETVLRTKQSVFGENSPSTLHSMHALAYTYIVIQRPHDALPLLKVCVERRGVVLGLAHGDTLSSMKLLASLYRGLKQFGDAVDVLKRCKQLCPTSDVYSDDVAAGEYLIFLSERYKKQCAAQRQPDLVSEMSEVLPRPPIRFRPVCPQGHSLRDSSFSSSPYAHSESYVCRACRGQSTPAQLRRWICEKCSVDLCFVCVDENGRALILE